jgi:hypothetical protein
MQRFSPHRLTAVTIPALMSLTILLAPSPAPGQHVIGIMRALVLLANVTGAIDTFKSVMWTNDTTKDLDQLLDMSVSISDELKKLNIALSTEPKAGFPEFVEKSLKAKIDQFESNQRRLAKYQTLTEAEQGSLQGLTKDFEFLVFLSCQYGPAAYETTYTATAVVRALYKYIDRPPGDQKVFFGKVDSYFSTWLDQSKKLKNDEEQKVKELDNRWSELEKSNLARRKWDTYVTGTHDDLELHNKNETQLVEVVSQLDRYHQSLLAVIGGGRLLLKELPRGNSPKKL